MNTGCGDERRGDLGSLLSHAWLENRKEGKGRKIQGFGLNILIE